MKYEKNILRGLEFLKDAPAISDSHTMVQNSRYLDAPASGCWYPRKKPGDQIQKGELLGEIRNIFSEPLCRIHAETDGVVLYVSDSVSWNRGRSAHDRIWRIGKGSMTMISAIEQRVRHYWTLRSHDFGTVRKNELENEMGQKWLREIERLLPEKDHLRILDVGTGTGFFAVLLAQTGHQVEGIDLTPAMLEEAKSLAAQRNLDIVFREMDAQALSYAEESFDVVLSRNLTWTLPEPEKAYREWFRVLKPGGWLLNFDADYAANVRSHSMQNCKVAPDSPYGHIGMTDALQQENDEITLSMDIGQLRPAWDLCVLRRIGFSDCRTDVTVGQRILGTLDLTHAPMFGIWARKA